MNRTKLYDWHVKTGAKMAPFAGYEMPISYPAGSVEEHLITRRSVGLFDIDHMGQVEIAGSGADAFVSELVSAKILDMKDGDARYSLMLNDKGTVLDDVFVYKLKNAWWLVINAGNRALDLEWINSHKKPDVTVVDKSDETYMIAVQGPRAIELLDKLSDTKISDYPRFTSGYAKVLDVPCLIGRTGYTGEDGVELFFPVEYAEKLWTGLLASGKTHGIETEAIGLAARDSLRFEAGMPLHGHEISQDINPIEAGFKWACDLEKNFIGKAAVEKMIETGAPRKLVGITVQGGVPREGYIIQDANGKDVGKVVAGMFCPSVKVFAANCFVEPSAGKIGTPLNIIIRGKPAPAVVVKRPLYIPAYKR